MRYAQSVTLTAAPQSLAALMINVTSPEDGFFELTLRDVGAAASIGNNAAQPYVLAVADGPLQFRAAGSLNNVWASGAGTLVILVTQ